MPRTMALLAVAVGAQAGADANGRQLTELLATVDSPGAGYAELRFFTANLATNNLGGMCGPGSGADAPSLESNPCEGQMEELRYANLGINSEGFAVDLKVTNLTAYLPFNAASNGIFGEFGMINILGNEPVMLEFCFVKSGYATCQHTSTAQRSRVCYIITCEAAVAQY